LLKIKHLQTTTQKLYSLSKKALVQMTFLHSKVLHSVSVVGEFLRKQTFVSKKAIPIKLSRQVVHV